MTFLQQWWHSVLDYFTPELLRDDPDGQRRAHLLAGLSILAGVFGCIYVTFYLVIGHFWGAGIIIGCDSLMVSAAFLMRFTGWMRLAANLQAMIWTVGFCALAAVEGGIHGHAISWLACGVPLLALLLLDLRTALVWCGICFVATLVFCGLELAHVNLPIFYPEAWRPAVMVAGYGGFAIFMTMLGLMFEQSRKHAFRRMQVALEELSHADERFRTSEHFAQRIADATPGLLYMLDLAKQRIVYANDRLLEVLGLPLHRNPNIDIHDLEKFMSAADFDRSLENLCRRLRTAREGEVIETEFQLDFPDGESHWLCRNAVFTRDRDGEPVCVLGLAQDITERKQADNALRESESRFREIFESSPDAIFVEDLEGTVLDVNPSACRLHGMSREELIGKGVRELVPPDWQKEIERNQVKVASGEIQSTEGFSLTTDGRSVPVLLSISRIQHQEKPALLIHVRDMTEFKRLQGQLLQSQKMDAIGRLAGGIAHDFNNLLTAIIGYNELLVVQLDSGSPALHYAFEIGNAAQRAAKLTHQLLAFSRKQTLELRPIDLNKVVAGIEKLLHRLIGDHIELVSIPEPNLQSVRADAGQMEQVIVNLIVNARDAMPRGGKLTIQTANLTVNDAEVPEAERRNLPPGHYVMFAVSDTGVGISGEVMEHLFEPFFTTKEEGKGTGLGLATCYGIVQQSGGHISVVSAPGAGATFEILLPSIVEQAEEVSEPPDAKHLPTGTETILLVEDRSEIRDLAVGVLRDQGYVVHEAENGEHALIVAARHAGEKIDLLLTDVMMPKMGGKELAEHFHRLYPATRILFCSGSEVETPVGGRDGAAAWAAFLKKPFTPTLLACKVRAVLDGGEENNR